MANDWHELTKRKAILNHLGDGKRLYPGDGVATKLLNHLGDGKRLKFL